MFVKFVREDSESVWECDFVRTEHEEKAEKEGEPLLHIVQIYMEKSGHDNCSSVRINKSERVAIYLMSDQGKTIDTIFYNL